jgi:uncharacterized membrane protein
MILDPLERYLPSCSWPRALAKTLTWRLFATLDTFLISIFITNNVKVAGSIVGIEVMTKLLWYVLHERAWARLSPRGAPPRRAGFSATGLRCLALHMHGAGRSSALK